MSGKKFVYAAIIFVLSIYCFKYDILAQENKLTTPVLSDNSIFLTSPVYSSYWLFSGDYNLVDNTIYNSPNDEFEDEFAEYVEQDNISDPLYYFNYLMYSFNDCLYFYLLKPLATGYKTIIPTQVRKGVANFFHNISFPVRFVNNIFQGKIKNAGTELEIFCINSTIGILGLTQVAQNSLGLSTHDEDLGQTLGKYSLGNGFYIVWPLLGPSTLRDTVGLIGDSFLMPVNYIEPFELSLAIKAFDITNETSFRLGDYEALKKASPDPYIAIREAYIKNRAKKIKE